MLAHQGEKVGWLQSSIIKNTGLVLFVIYSPALGKKKEKIHERSRCLEKYTLKQVDLTVTHSSPSSSSSIKSNHNLFHYSASIAVIPPVLGTTRIFVQYIG